MSQITAGKKRRFAFDVLKLAAVLLVFNSHLDALYPDRLKFLATGGIWGNTLFFAVSGYFVNVDTGFGGYLKKKIIRLYPSVIVFTVISLVFHLRDIVIGDVGDIVAEFIWPTYYWFVGTLILYYLLIYLLEKKRIVSSKFPFFLIGSGVLLLLCFACCSAQNIWCMEKMGFDTFEGWLKIIYYFPVFSLGYYLKKNNGVCRKVGMKTSVLLIAIGGIGYMGYKLLLVKAYIPMIFQIFAPVLLFLLASGALCFTVGCEKRAESSRNKAAVPEKVVSFLSALSLEVYLVQFPVIHLMENSIFPINIVLALLITFGLAYLLKKLSSYLVNCGIKICSRLFRTHFS